MFFLVLLAFFKLAYSDELVQIQVIFRHGDRTPMECFPTDPNLPVWAAELPGELTTIGMRQHYNQGLKMKARYIDELKIINSTYRRKEIFIRSAEAPRWIQSAAANMAGFYSGSKGTFPYDAPGWPSNWTPMPVHSLEPPLQHLLDPGHECLEDNKITTERADNKEFVDYLFSFMPMLGEIAELSGIGLMDLKALILFYDCVRVEKEFRNMTLAKWITPKLYNELDGLYWRTDNFMNGRADFGVEDDPKLMRIRGGALLTEILSNMEAAINGTDTTKMFVYSGHDTTLVALWNILGAKMAMSGERNPDYAAHYVLELWRNGTSYYIKAIYSPNESSQFVTKTNAIRGCGGGDSCPFGQFKQICGPYKVENIIELCDKVI